jgi:hypothetical protein
MQRAVARNFELETDFTFTTRETSGTWVNRLCPEIKSRGLNLDAFGWL